MAEVVKHAIIGNKDLWDMLVKAEALSTMDWNLIIGLSVQIKQQIVALDPFEKGIRKTLNFGHTIGHALESSCMLTDHPFSHGRAVTFGMMVESTFPTTAGDRAIPGPSQHIL